MQGAVLCLSNLVLHWNVQSLADVSVDSLAVLDIIRPKPGDRLAHSHNQAVYISSSRAGLII